MEETDRKTIQQQKALCLQKSNYIKRKCFYQNLRLVFFEHFINIPVSVCISLYCKLIDYLNTQD